MWNDAQPPGESVKDGGIAFLVALLSIHVTIGMTMKNDQKLLNEMKSEEQWFYKIFEVAEGSIDQCEKIFNTSIDFSQCTDSNTWSFVNMPCNSS